MKKIIIIGLLFLGLFVAGASGQSVVTLDDNQGVLDLVFSSSTFVGVSSFEVLLQCDSDVSITKITGVAPYEIFYGVPDENGYVTIAGFTIEPPVENQKTVFAKISTSGPGFIHVIGVEMDDFDRQEIYLDNSGLVTPVTQVNTPSPTTVSTSTTPVVTQPPSVPTYQQTKNAEPSVPSTPASTMEVPPSNDPPSTPAQTPLGVFPILIGLAGAGFFMRRTNY